jgi:hypothetical protein
MCHDPNYENMGNGHEGNPPLGLMTMARMQKTRGIAQWIPSFVSSFHGLHVQFLNACHEKEVLAVLQL